MRVLQAMMERMRDLHESQGVPVLHYRQLDAEAMEQIARRFDLHAGEAARQRIAARLRQHAKALDQRFEPDGRDKAAVFGEGERQHIEAHLGPLHAQLLRRAQPDRKSTRLNSSHSQISYAVFCLKKKKQHNNQLLTKRLRKKCRISSIIVS